MPRRTPPDPAAIITTITSLLLTADGGHAEGSAGGASPGRTRAIRWDIAVKCIRDHHHTTRPTAEQWIKNALAAPDCALVGLLLLNDCLQLMVTTRNQPDVRGDDMGWPTETRAAVWFDAQGNLLPLNSATRPHTPAAWIVPRSALTDIRASIEHQIADRNHEQALRQAERDAAFVAMHGDDLAAITALVDGIVDPFTDEYNPAKIITTSVAAGTSGTKLAELCGTSGRLTIELWGTQITAFADRLRALRADAHDLARLRELAGELAHRSDAQPGSTT